MLFRSLLKISDSGELTYFWFTPLVRLSSTRPPKPSTFPLMLNHGNITRPQKRSRKLPSSFSVSYTHLDVYKRQVYRGYRVFYRDFVYNLYKKRVKEVPCFSRKISIFGRIFEKKHSINQMCIRDSLMSDILTTC